MSNTQWHAQNKPNWWVRAGREKNAVFLDIGYHRGDQILDVEIEIHGNIRWIIVGAGNKEKGVRERIYIID